MKRVALSSILFGLLLLVACAPRVKTYIMKTYPPLDYKEEVIVLGITDQQPA